MRFTLETAIVLSIRPSYVGLLSMHILRISNFFRSGVAKIGS